MSEPRVRIVASHERSTDTPQTPGLRREVASGGRNPDAECVVRSHPDPFAVRLREFDRYARQPARAAAAE